MDWNRPKFHALPLPPGHYEIRIGVSAGEGWSCCAFEILDIATGAVVHGPLLLSSGPGESTHWRACYAAIAGGLELLPSQSSAAIVCFQHEAMKVVERIPELVNNGWLKADGKPIANFDILQRIKQACEEEVPSGGSRIRTLTFVYDPSLEQRIAVDRLQKLAAEELRKKKAE